MANRQPGHHTFGIRSKDDMWNLAYANNLLNGGTWDQAEYTTVFDSTYKRRNCVTTNHRIESMCTGNEIYIPYFGEIVSATWTARPVVTGLLVTAGTTAINDVNGYILRRAKSTADFERVIGVVSGSTGTKTGNYPRYASSIQYSGEAPILLALGESVNIRGRMLQLSTGASGTAVTNQTLGLGQFGVCTTGGYASGLTAGWNYPPPGGATWTSDGVTGNYVSATIRPVETN